MIGKLLDYRYQVIRVLAMGGFGQTYIAKDTKRPGNPICVVKHLKPASNDAKVFETARRLFQGEAETLEKLGHHDQIPRLLAYFDENKEFFLVQEFIEGHTLSEELINGEQRSESQVIELLHQILSILAFVHQQGVIHRDIKPDNIIRRESDNKLVLVDFGAMKQLRASPGSPMLASVVTVGAQPTATVAIGTPGYMPTEQGQGKPRPNSDLYALGIIAIQALTSVAPIDFPEDHHTGEIIWQHLVPVSPELATLLNTMVRYHFKDRYQSAVEALEALQSFTRPEGGKQYSIPNYQAIKPASPSRQKTLAVAPLNRIPSKPVETNIKSGKGGSGLDLLQLLIVIALGSGAAAVAPIAVKNVQNLVNNFNLTGDSRTASEQTCLAIVAANSNIRSEPVSVYSEDIVQTVARDTKFEVTGKRTEHGWVQLKFNGKSAWVNSDVIKNNDQWISCLRDKDIGITVVNDNNFIAERPAPKPHNQAIAPDVATALPQTPQPTPTSSTQGEQQSKILEQAKKKYESGDLEGAIALLKSIPSGIEQTTKTIGQWQQEWSQAQSAFNDINTAINNGQWNKVLAYKDQLPNIPYWRDKIQPLLQQAAENIAKQQLANLTNSDNQNKPKQEVSQPDKKVKKNKSDTKNPEDQKSKSSEPISKK